MREHHIHIVERGTKIRINEKGEYNIVKDDGCIWSYDNKLYFTELAWKRYRDKRTVQR